MYSPQNSRQVPGQCFQPCADWAQATPGLHRHDSAHWLRVAEGRPRPADFFPRTFSSIHDRQLASGLRNSFSFPLGLPPSTQVSISNMKGRKFRFRSAGTIELAFSEASRRFTPNADRFQVVSNRDVMRVLLPQFAVVLCTRCGCITTRSPGFTPWTRLQAI